MLPNILTAEQLSDKFLTPPYHQWLGLSLQTLNDDGVELSIRWRPEFVVNVDPGNTHAAVEFQDLGDIGNSKRVIGLCDGLQDG